jgi:hypothetical protein
LSRKYSGPKEHIQLKFYREVFHGFLMQQKTKLCGLEYHRGRVYKHQVCEAMWLHKLLTDLLDHEMDPMVMTKSRE